MQKKKNIRNPKDGSRILRKQGISLSQRMSGARPVIKDPIALFSAEWLCEKFYMDMLFMIRHPAAFCSSLKVKNWHFDFNNFLDQPLLMAKYLDVYADDIRKCVGGEVDGLNQDILLWNCVHHTIKHYQENHSDWLFVRHEDLSRDPEKEFQFIFNAFRLDFTPAVASIIQQSSGSHNPIEQNPSKECLRDSRKNIHNWKTRLSEKEIDQIRIKTAEIADAFYTEDDW